MRSGVKGLHSTPPPPTGHLGGSPSAPSDVEPRATVPADRMHRQSDGPDRSVNRGPPAVHPDLTDSERSPVADLKPGPEAEPPAWLTGLRDRSGRRPTVPRLSGHGCPRPQAPPSSAPLRPKVGGGRIAGSSRHSSWPFRWPGMLGAGAPLRWRRPTCWSSAAGILDGRLPHADVEYLYAPGTVWAVAGAFWTFGAVGRGRATRRPGLPAGPPLGDPPALPALGTGHSDLRRPGLMGRHRPVRTGGLPVDHRTGPAGGRHGPGARGRRRKTRLDRRRALRPGRLPPTGTGPGGAGGGATGVPRR